MKNIDFKKILLFALGLILLFIPTYIAIASYNSQKPSENLPTVSTLTISDPEGRTSTVTSDNDPGGVFEMFNSINASGTPVSSLPDSLAGNGFLLVTFSTPDNDQSYKYYSEGDTLLLTVKGEVDHHSAKGLRERMDDAIFMYRPKKIIISLGSVSLMDSSGLGLIVGRLNTAQQIGATLTLRDVKGQVMKILRLAGMDRLEMITVEGINGEPI